jgi:hypothetical protein
MKIQVISKSTKISNSENLKELKDLKNVTQTSKSAHIIDFTIYLRHKGVFKIRFRISTHPHSAKHHFKLYTTNIPQKYKNHQACKVYPKYD